VNLGNPQFFRAVFRDRVARLQDQGILTSQRAGQWQAGPDAWTRAGDFLGDAALFVVAASRPR
jgi:hypothetical protein